MKKIALLLSFSISFIWIYAQTEQKNYVPSKRASIPQDRYETYSKMLIDNYAKQKTYEYFEGMFTTRIPYYAYYQSLALSYSNLGEPADSVFFYFEKALLLDSVKVCSWFKFYSEKLVPNKKLQDWRLLDSVRFDYYKTKCDRCTLEFENQIALERNKIEKDSTLNHALIADLKKMFNEDQLYRKMMNGVSKKADLDVLWQLQTQNDCKNQDKLEDIFKKYGYPSKKLVSKYHYATATIILLHTPADFQRKYLPLMITAFNNNDVSVMDMIMLLDKIYSGEQRKQMFGTQSGSTGEAIQKIAKKESIKILNDLGLSKLINEL